MTDGTDAAPGRVYPWMGTIEALYREEQAAGHGEWRPSRPGATEADIAALERRLGLALPPSYRQFLATAAGVTDVLAGDFLAAADVDWCRTLAPNIIEDYRVEDPQLPDEEYFDYDRHNYGSYRAGHLEKALLISKDEGSGVYLLNPEVITEDGEWEAWFLAYWYPGADRRPSFWALMQQRIADATVDAG